MTVPNSKPIGIWGQRHRRYLRQHKYGTYTAFVIQIKIRCHQYPHLCR
nr:TnpV protein [Butyricicoccus sp. BIOML-A1]